MRRAVRACRGLLLPALACVLSQGCGLELPEGLAADAEQLADDAVDAQDTIAVAASISGLSALALNSDTVTLADAVARQAELNTLFDEAGCLTVETVGNTVTYTFDRCTGPWGQVEVSGREIAVFSPGPSAGSFAVELASEDLEVNGRAATHSGSLVIAVESGKRSISWSGAYDGSVLFGKVDVHHEADLELVLSDDGGMRLDGTSSTTVGARGLELTVQNLERSGPKGTCPSGSVVAKRKLTKLEVTLTFDGSNELAVASSRGGHDTFDLECTPAADG